MVSLKEVKEKARRHNQAENEWVHPFSARISIVFSWLFINLGLSANQVTIVFFLCGILSGVTLLFDEFYFAILAFILFRLHVLFDVCDGEVARYRDQISKFGIYWDQLIHFFTYPFILLCLGYSRLENNFNAILFAFVAIGVLGKVVDLAAKNTFYRVLYLANDTPQTKAETSQAKKNKGGLVHLIKQCFKFLGFDGLLFLNACVYLIPFSLLGYTGHEWLVILFSLQFIVFGLARIVMIPYFGRIPVRSDLKDS